MDVNVRIRRKSLRWNDLDVKIERKIYIYILIFLFIYLVKTYSYTIANATIWLATLIAIYSS